SLFVSSRNNRPARAGCEAELHECEGAHGRFPVQALGLFGMFTTPLCFIFAYAAFGRHLSATNCKSPKSDPRVVPSRVDLIESGKFIFDFVFFGENVMLSFRTAMLTVLCLQCFALAEAQEARLVFST